MSEDVLILKTGLLYEATMLTENLQSAGIPHYHRMETFTGLQFAMPAFPAQGPGTFFSVYVPAEAEDDARLILYELPIEPGHPGMWAYNPKPWAKKITIAAIAVYLIFHLVSIAGVLWNSLMHAFS